MNLLIYLAAINLLTFGFYWLDKRAARRSGWRIPEAQLLVCGFLGGTVAAFIAMKILRHKNRKRSFQFKFWALTLVQIGLLVLQPEPLPRIFAVFY